MVSIVSDNARNLPGHEIVMKPSILSNAVAITLRCAARAVLCSDGQFDFL
jgi:hypothetical protein